MLKNSKLIIVVAIIVCMLIIGFIMVQSINEKAVSKDYFLIGVSQPNLTDPWRIVMNEEISKEIEGYKNLRVIFTDATHNPEKQIQDIDKLKGFGIDLLIVSMSDADALSPHVSEIYDEIPVIVLDRDVLGYDYSLFIGLDNDMIGENAGRFVAKESQNNQITVLELTGDKESLSTEGRTAGFKKAVSDYDNIMILDAIECNWKRDEAQDRFNEYLDEGREVPDVIYAHSDDMAYGAYLAAYAHGVSDEINIIGMDALEGEKRGLNLVEQGILRCTFTCPTGGKEAVRYAVEILNKERIMPKKVILRSHEITRETLADYRAEKVYRDKDPSDITVGFAQVGAESAWRNANTESIIEAAADAGVNLIFENVDNSLSDEDKQKEQIRIMELFIEEKVDVIAFSPIVETGWDELLIHAKEAGIPVILSDRAVDNHVELWATFIGSDFVEEGRRAARWLLEQQEDQKNVQIVELQGTKGSAPAIGRSEGFIEIINAEENYNIIYSGTANFEKADGRAAMRNILAEYGDAIDVVYAHNDDMALGAIEAIEAYGLTAGTDIIVISVDATKEAFNAMVIGKLNCAVECNPLLGPQIMKSAIQLANGREIPIRIVTEESVYTTDNADDFIRTRKY